MSAPTLALTEPAWQAQVLQVARLYRWTCYHTYDSRRSQPGFPDLVLVRDRVLFRELKTDRGRITPDQQRWLDTLRAAGADADVWRPGDLHRVKRELAR